MPFLPSAVDPQARCGVSIGGGPPTVARRGRPLLTGPFEPPLASPQTLRSAANLNALCKRSKSQGPSIVARRRCPLCNFLQMRLPSDEGEATSLTRAMISIARVGTKWTNGGACQPRNSVAIDDCLCLQSSS